MGVVRRRRSLRVILGIVLALGVRTVVAAPAQITAELRAVSCCSGHLNRPVSVPESRRCCDVSPDAGAPAKLTAVQVLDAPPAVLLVTVPLPTAVRQAPSVAQTERRSERDGPPLYLGLRSIRC
jgi:hypothetical protein